MIMRLRYEVRQLVQAIDRELALEAIQSLAINPP